MTLSDDKNKHTVIASADEEQALEWAAAQADPPQDADAYFDARMHEVLADYVRQYSIQTAVAPVDDVAVAYATAPAAEQAQVAAILNVPLVPLKSA